MRSLPIPTVLLACLALASCGGRAPLDLDETPDQASFRQDFSSVPLDAADITSATVQGDQLRVQVRHGGGCREHHFALYLQPVFMESNPVQVAAQLAHDAHGDPCRALVGKELHFDLGPLKERYQRAYSRSGTVVIQLREPGPAPSTVSVRYSF